MARKLEDKNLLADNIKSIYRKRDWNASVGPISP